MKILAHRLAQYDISASHDASNIKMRGDIPLLPDADMTRAIVSVGQRAAAHLLFGARRYVVQSFVLLSTEDTGFSLRNTADRCQIKSLAIVAF